MLGFVAPSLLPDFDPVRDGFVVLKAHNPDAAGKNFSELDTASQQAILNYEFSVQVLPTTMDDREVVQLFRRLNSTNYVLNKQELRNATYFGHFKSSALMLSAEQLHRWRQWGTFNDDDISRMHEVELTSECMLSLIEGKVGGRSARRLDAAYKEFDETFGSRVEVERRFQTSMQAIADNFTPKHLSSPLLKKRLIYTLGMSVADALFDLSNPVSKRIAIKKISTSAWSNLFTASEAIVKRTAPVKILEATDRRTTNIKERLVLFNFLKSCF